MNFSRYVCSHEDGGSSYEEPAAFGRDCTCTRTECGTYILPVHRICAHVNMWWLSQDGRLITHKVGRSRLCAKRRPPTRDRWMPSRSANVIVSRCIRRPAWVDALENSLRSRILKIALTHIFFLSLLLTRARAHTHTHTHTHAHAHTRARTHTYTHTHTHTHTHTNTHINTNTNTQHTTHNTYIICLTK